MERYVPPGGKSINLAVEWYKTDDGVRYHPGDHPAFASTIRWGRLADGRWWVASSLNEARGEWVFERQRDQEETIVELELFRRDGRWENRPTTAEGLGSPRVDH